MVELPNKDLMTLVRSLPLELFQKMETEYNYYLRKQLLRSVDDIIKNRFSLGYVKDNLSIPNNVLLIKEPRSIKEPQWTYHYDSLTSLFCSPYISNLDLAIDISSTIISNRPSYSLRNFSHSNEAYLDPLKLINHIGNIPICELPLDISEDKFIEFIRLGMGPNSLFDIKKYKHKNPLFREGLISTTSKKMRQARVSKYRVKQLTRGYYLRKVINSMVSPISQRD